MGNDSSSQGNRGQPLGGGSTNPSRSSRGQALGSSSSDPRRDAAARQARQNLVTAKKKAPNELQRKEKILDMLHAAEDPEYREAKNRSAPASSTTTSSSSPARAKPKPASSHATTSGVFMAEPASAQARAAEERMAKKNKKSRKLAAQDRKNRTADLLFGDGLSSEPSEQVASSSPSPQPQRPSPSSSSSSKKKAQDVWMAGGSAAEAAASRMQGKMTANRQQAIQERRDRTIELLHGDALAKPDDIPDQPDTERDLEWKTDMPEDQVQIKRTFLNLANCNPHETVPTTAKLLRKIIRNVLKANSLAEQEKYGKLRCSNAKIRESILDVQFGVDTLLVLGFVRRMLPNERSGDLEEYMIYDYSLENQSQLWFALNLIDTYYPEVS